MALVTPHRNARKNRLAAASVWLVAGALVLGAAQAGHTLQDAAVPTVPPLILEDFEGTALGSKPYLWKIEKPAAFEATVGSEKVELNAVRSNKALQFDYQFPLAADASQVISAGPGMQSLPGSLSAVKVMVFGDGSKNALALRIQDRLGEGFEWQMPVTWTGWRAVSFSVNPATAARTGGARANGVLDAPLYLDKVRLVRTAAGARKGKLLVDDLTAECAFGKVTTLYDTDGGVKLDGWKANKNRAVIGEVADNLVPRNGKDQSVLKLEYQYENSGDAAVEFSKVIPTGAPGHGTLIAEVFGDGSNNVLRFRMLDGQDRPWSGNWASILVDWSGWKTLYLDTRTLKDPDAQDPNALLEKLPLKFYSVVVDDVSGRDQLPGVESGRKGEIFLARLLFAAEK